MSDWTLFETHSCSDAEFSDCGRYRYTLTRRWDDSPQAVFVMLNPSTATAVVNDPTIRRCMGYARAWECGGLVVVNLYAWRATDPRELWKTADPVGPDNDDHLARCIAAAATDGAPTIAAWGANAKPDRVKAVLQMPHADRLKALGVTKSGAPRHPLYMPGTATPQRWPVTS